MLGKEVVELSCGHRAMVDEGVCIRNTGRYRVAKAFCYKCLDYREAGANHGSDR
jgi:hypothetical protein